MNHRRTRFRALAPIVLAFVATTSLAPVASAGPFLGRPRSSQVRRSASARVDLPHHLVHRLNPALGLKRLDASRMAARTQHERPSAGRLAVAFGRGATFDGPRHTLRAIKRNPLAFAGGLVAIGGLGAAAQAFGFAGHWIAVALSSAALAFQFKTVLPRLRQSRGTEQANALGAEVVWPLALFAGTWVLGDRLAVHPEAGHASAASASTAGSGAAINAGIPVMGSVVAGASPQDIGSAFVSSVVIGGDTPAVGVTALDNMQGDRAGASH
jgi:hypothetical protein